MLIEQIPSGPFETNAYIIACEETRECAIIDPAPDSAAEITAFIETNKLKPTQILLTHSHWDHIGDVAPLKKQYVIPVYIHPKDAGNLEKPGTDGLPMFGALEEVKADGELNEGQNVKVGNLSFNVIETPGHTPGGICFFGEGILISGDTLFHGSIGNLSFPTAEPEKMWPSLQRLMRLPPETKVYPGHGPATTIDAESWLPDAKRIFQL